MTKLFRLREKKNLESILSDPLLSDEACLQSMEQLVKDGQYVPTVSEKIVQRRLSELDDCVDTLLRQMNTIVNIACKSRHTKIHQKTYMCVYELMEMLKTLRVEEEKVLLESLEKN